MRNSGLSAVATGVGTLQRLSAVVLLCSTCLAGEDDDAMLAIVEDGTRANTAATPYVVASCNFTTGSAETAESAFRGELHSDDMVHATGYCAVDGDCRRFDLIYHADVTKAHETPSKMAGYVNSPYESRRVQYWNGHQLMEFPGRSRAVIMEAQKLDPLLAKVSPLDLGYGSLPAGDQTLSGFIDRYKSATTPVTLEILEPTNLNQTECWQLRFTEVDKKRAFTFFVAPQFGFVPLRTVITKNGNVIHETRVLSVHSVTDDAWLPVRAITVLRRSNGQLFVRDISFTDVQVTRPTAEQIGLTLPAGTRVLDADNEYTWTMATSDTIDLRTYTLGKYQTSNADYVSSDLTTETPRRTSYWLVVGHILALCLVLGAIAVFKMWQRR